MGKHLVKALPIGRLERALDILRHRAPVVIVGRQAKAGRTARQRHADPAHAYDPQPLAPNPVPEHRGRAPARPATASDQSFAFGQSPCNCEDQRHRHVGSVLGQHPRCVGHDDAALLRRSEVDVVDPGPEGGDQLEPRAGGRQHLGIDSVGDRRNENIGSADRGAQL